MATYQNIGNQNVDGVKIGAASSTKIGFFGATPVIRPSASSFATSNVGTASSADVTTALTAAVIAIGNSLSALGIWPAQA